MAEKEVHHEGRVTSPSPKMSRATLEFIDGLLDGVTLSAQASDFVATAKLIESARDGIDALLVAAGGVPVRLRRAQEQG